VAFCPVTFCPGGLLSEGGIFCGLLSGGLLSRGLLSGIHAAAVLIGLKFADNIHYKFKSIQASEARLQSSKHTSAKENLMQNDDSKSFKVTCFGLTRKAITD